MTRPPRNLHANELWSSCANTSGERSRVAATEHSHGREPVGRPGNAVGALVGATDPRNLSPLTGLCGSFERFHGLTPEAKFCRRYAAESNMVETLSNFIGG